MWVSKDYVCVCLKVRFAATCTLYWISMDYWEGLVPSGVFV